MDLKVMRSLKTILSFSVVSASYANIRVAEFGTSTVQCGTTPQQRQAAQGEARKRATVIHKFVSLAQGAVKAGGGVKDPSANKGLARILDQCTKEGIPKKTILNALVESNKTLNAETTFLITNPTGMASLIGCRAASLTHGRSMLTRHLKKSMFSGSMTELKHLGDYFERKGVVMIEPPTNDGEPLTDDENMDLAIEVNAEEVQKTEEGLKFICDAASLKTVLDAFEEKGTVVLYSNLDYLPTHFCDADLDNRQFYKLFLSFLQRKESPSDKSVDFTELANNFEK